MVQLFGTRVLRAYSLCCTISLLTAPRDWESNSCGRYKNVKSIFCISGKKVQIGTNIKKRSSLDTFKLWQIGYYWTLHHNWSKTWVTHPKLKLLGIYLGKYINFKITQITLKPNFDHLFATYSYTFYRRIGEFLMNSNRRSSYLSQV